MKDLAKLIVKAVSILDPVAAAAGCGCNLPHNYDMAGIRQVFKDLAAEFDFEPEKVSSIVPGNCSDGVLQALARAWGEKNSVSTCNVWVYGGAIVLHHVPADHPLYAALRELTTQEVCDSGVMERRQIALEKK